jgi:DNA-binding transcriptional LysR family regulator
MNFVKLQQIKAFCVVADEDMSISRAAAALCTTQSAVSKQVRQLEDALGATLLVRSKSRILGLTELGHDVLKNARSILAASHDITQIVADHQRRRGGRLAIATTHTHARYALHDIIPAFARSHPEVSLHIVQATPGEITDLVLSGQVDLGISTMPRDVPASIAALPCYALKHVLVGMATHPIFKLPSLTLQAIAAYPLITYSHEHAIGRCLTGAFEAAGLAQKIAVRGADVEVMKYYASCGLGLAVIPLIAYSEALDPHLSARSVDHLFDASTVFVVARRGAYWPLHLYEFVGELAPALTRTAIEKGLSGNE